MADFSLTPQYNASSEDDSEQQLPAYFLASQVHTALRNKPEDDEGGFVESAIDLVTKGVPAALIAAGNELSNIPSNIGNVISWLTGGEGDEYETVTNAARIQELDSSLEEYYNDHKLGTDLAGFVISSFVPGGAGVKALRGGQTVLRGAIESGNMGTLTAKSFGLLAPNRERRLADAIKAAQESGNAFRYGEANLIAAMRNGVWQNALEGAVFTAATNATMYTSPILEDRDVSDLMTDVVYGGAFGAVLGGGLQGIGAIYGVRKGLKEAEAQLMPWAITESASKSASASDKIVLKRNQLANLPEVPDNHPLARRATATRDATTNTLWQEIRGHVGELTNGDQTLADMLFSKIKAAKPIETERLLVEATSVTRINVISGAEKKARAAFKKKLALEATDAEVEEALRHKVTYINTHTGAQTLDRPMLTDLADTLKPGETISIPKGGKGIQVGKRFYPMENNPHRPFNIMGADSKTVQARYHWAESLEAWKPGEDILIHANDVPLLQKAIRDGIDNVKIIPESGLISDARKMLSIEELTQFTKAKQAEIAARMLKAETMPQTVEELVDKLKHYFGINFSVVDDATAPYYGFFARIREKIDGVKSVLDGDVIALEKTGILSRPLSQVIRTLKHEEGHAIFESLISANGINRANLDTVYKDLYGEIMAVSKRARPGLWKSKDAATKAYRENWHEMFADSFFYFSKNPNQLKNFPHFDQFAGHLVRPIPQHVLDATARRATKPTIEEISKVVNAHPDALRLTADGDNLWNLRQFVRETTADPKVWDKPTYLKVTTESDRLRDVDGNLLEGLAIVAQKEKLYQQRADRIVAASLGEELPSAVGYAGKPIGSHAGAGAIASANGNYGSWTELFSYVGQRVHNITKNLKEKTSDIFNPTLQRLATNREAAIEWSVLNERLRGLPNNYFLDTERKVLTYGRAPRAEDFESVESLTKAMAKHSEDISQAVADGLPAEIAINSDDVLSLVASHIDVNSQRQSILASVHANNGYQHRVQDGVFYPIPRNPNNTPHFAFVINDTVTGTGHSKMIYAKDADTLQLMINEIQSDTTLTSKGIKVLTKGDAENYYKSVGQFEFERTLSDNYINNALARKGKSQSFIPVTDPSRIVRDFLEWHHARDTGIVRTLVEHKYQTQFDTLRAMAEPSIQAAKSRGGYISPQAFAENTASTPASSLIKLALNISKVDEYPLWTPLNKFLDRAYSTLLSNVTSSWKAAKALDDLDGIYADLKKAGFNDIISPEALAAANKVAPSGSLTALVNKANAIVATFAIRSDPFNAINNTVGNTVLMGAEMKALVRAIQSGNKDAAGELAQLANITVPGSGGDMILSPAKLVARRIGMFHTDKEGRAWFKKHGYISTISDQYDQTLDHLALALSSGDSIHLHKAFRKAKELGDLTEKISGNKLAEEFNRYIAAGVAKDITDIAVKHGIIDSGQQLAMINTFVNRTQGNYLASQRPIIFQGPIGQAIGLFQTYQFNLLQQLFRHVGEGHWKDVAIMAGLQGGVYGLNGMPAFNAINTHIIGQAGGNINNKTLYDAVYSGAGKEAGDWLLYGAASNALSIFHPDLKTNIYTRGDINPRHVTLVPMSPEHTPIYQATERFFSNLKNMYTRVEMGGDLWSTFLKGVEQNGISRPLAGMAQILNAAGRDDKKVISTNRQGNMLMAHDLASLMSLARVAGAKPLDEAIVNDQMFRYNTFRAADAAKRKALGETIKQTILSGKIPSEEQIAKFAEVYAKTGGNQSEFAAFMANQSAKAHTSQAEILRRRVDGPRTELLQLIMKGGTDD